MSMDLEEMTRAMMTNLGWPKERAEAAARKQLGMPAIALIQHVDLPEGLSVAEARARRRAMQEGRTITPLEIELAEKEIGAECDKLMLALGWRVVNFSQARPSKLTAGIPDRKYYDPRRGLSFWMELKTIDGRQSPDQVEFQKMAEACEETYLLGGLGDLQRYFIAMGLVERFTAEGLPVLFVEEPRR